MSELADIDITERETNLWERYLAGELSVDEVAELHHIVQGRGEDVCLLSAAASQFYDVRRADLSRFWLDRLHARLGRVPGVRRLGHARPLWMRLAMPATTIAAVIIGMLIVLHPRHAPATSSTATYTTPAGERATIELPDGTVVSLNVASRIEVPQDFGARDRVVRLRGDADFRVTRHAGVPFTVEAGGTRTVVLGTEFGVRAYDPGVVQVAVRTGRVMVKSMVLGARDIATVTPHEMTVAHDQNLDAALGFTQGRLVLNNMPLRETLPDLERWYDVKIQLRDPSVGDILVHAVLTNGSIGDLMEALRVTLGLHVVCEGRTLTLGRR